jgi:hypothetical protein
MSISDDDGRSLSIGQFCQAEGFSLSTYFKLRQRGLGPEETRPLGCKIIRISPEAHAAWRERMSSRHRAQQRELERRRAQAAEAGRAAARSPRHVSRRRRGGDHAR